MSDYDQDYFFIRGDEDNERRPALKPDMNTSERRYAQFPPPPGSAPLIFTNAFRDEFLADGVKDEACDILFDGIYFIVRDHIRERLLQLDIPEVFLHPAVYIDDRGNWHEDYWFVGVQNELDCWDREKSTFGKKTVVIGDETLYNMFSYSLNTKLLDEKPLQDRLLFKMGGTARGLITCHKSIAGIFRGGGKSGAQLQAITDY
jgi:hypothetical protein